VFGKVVDERVSKTSNAKQKIKTTQQEYMNLQADIKSRIRDGKSVTADEKLLISTHEQFDRAIERNDDKTAEQLSNKLDEIRTKLGIDLEKPSQKTSEKPKSSLPRLTAWGRDAIIPHGNTLIG
jgi:predicted transcriptional regulator